MNLEITVTKEEHLAEIKECLSLGKTNKPAWWKESKGDRIVKCPSVVDVVNNSLVFKAPSDIKITWNNDGSLHFTTPAFDRGEAHEPLEQQLNINLDPEAPAFYKYIGGGINFRVQLNAYISSTDNRTVKTMWVPNPFFQEGFLTNRYIATTGSVNFPNTWPLPPVAMMTLDNNSREPLLIKKGDVLGTYFVPEGIGTVTYKINPTQKHRSYKYLTLGKDYYKASMARGCPYGYTKSKYRDIKNLLNSWWKNVV